MSTIAVAGDFYAPPGAQPECGEELTELVSGCDAAMINFEGPVAGDASPAFKTGPATKQDPTGPKYIRRVGFTAACLANNHILDFGSAGLRSTVTACEDAGLSVIGIQGPALDRRTLDVPSPGSPICVINVCEEEWVQGVDGSGGCVFSPIATVRLVRAQVAAGKAPVVVLHGGNEYYPYPSPWLRDAARFLVESGAVAVVVHHSHVLAGYEYWNGSPIAYGIGNFQYMADNPHSEWYEGALALLRWDGDRSPKLELRPIVMDPGTFQVDVARGAQAEEIRRSIAARSAEITSGPSMAAHWRQFLADNRAMYLRQALPSGAAHGRIINAATARMWARYAEGNQAELAYLLNSIRCDSHRVALMGVLDELMPDGN